MREQILKDSAKYIEQFKGKIFIIKFGGSMLDDKVLSDSILDDIVSFHEKGIKIAVVHGGGSRISSLMKERGKEPVFAHGFRVTDKETAVIVDDALTQVNEELVKQVGLRGVSAISLLSREKKVIAARRKKGAVDEDFLGEVESINSGLIGNVLGSESVPIISPVGIGCDGSPYNINADIAASEIASAVRAEKLMLLTNVKGVMTDKDDEKTLITHIDEKQAVGLIEKGVIHSGMIPKVKAGIKALDSGVKKVHIISGRILHSLLLEVFTDEGIGTEIVR